ncbi:sulfatase-like hydrolase/transferase [Planktotalea sp.]|uniref:sulfatase-like hydrolase/transferase n=1 Tax=Planktotalea sp. TaxID=2029877 RepID=UPI003D6B5705
MPKNILFVMCDQLRHDYLGCTGHPVLKTPNIDMLAENGVRFSNAYVPAPLCGPCRMSVYTGRYPRSHGSYWNGSPLRIGEMNFGDHLNPLKMRTALCGKTHMTPDLDGMARLGIDPCSPAGQRISECGFELWDRLDGVYPAKGTRRPSHYFEYLNEKGYKGDNPWHDWANSAEGADGELKTGWFIENNDLPARIAEEDSETPYTTSRSIEFIEKNAGDSWCLHLSYIKPHWPYIVPEPYASMYGPEDVPEPNRNERERENSGPLLGAQYEKRSAKMFAREKLRDKAIPAYMGLIKQIDDQLGRVFEALKDTGQWEDTLIVFTSDHGDYFGDHWLGDKEFFHEEAVKVPLILFDPTAAADATRGSVCYELVEGIDLLPTFVDFAGGEPNYDVLEGHSLMPFLHDPKAQPVRDYAISEVDFSETYACTHLGLPVDKCRMVMVFDGRFKAVFSNANLPPVLFDLENDPKELRDIGREASSIAALAKLRAHLDEWSMAHHTSGTTPISRRIDYEDSECEIGVLIGFYDEQDVKDTPKAVHPLS